MSVTFDGNFTQQEPIPEDAIAAAVAVMRSGRLHRYNLLEGEIGEVSALETEFAALTGARHALAVASGGYALAIALRAVGVKAGDAVLTNAFTLAPVPGAIDSAGGVPVLVETTQALTIDFDDLERKAGSAHVLLLSHMRGHVCDMDRLVGLCRRHGLTLIEDCAHTMGAAWRGVPSGRHGAVGCYSTQTYKHVNSGEGGLLVTDDEQLAARLILLSGSYGFPDRHGTAPSPETVAGIAADVPNMSGRMDALRAAVLRPQLRTLATRCAAWTDRYRAVEAALERVPGLTLIPRPAAEAFVGSSIQFLLLDWPSAKVAGVVRACAGRGVILKWFGAAPSGYTSTYRHWSGLGATRLPQTDRILSATLDMRLPLTFSLEDCALIGRIIREEVAVHVPGDAGKAAQASSVDAARGPA